ncbi:MAG: hypothetical protein LWY06_02560 [Firmicutes bacterium]|nr:hypothetical protein [Bacillota bacterium]
MAKLILVFIYYFMLGIGSLFNKIFGINPFARTLENGSYWKKKTYTGNGKGYRFTQKPDSDATSYS